MPVRFMMPGGRAIGLVEPVEDVRQHLRRHARAGVGDADRDKRPRASLFRLRRGILQNHRDLPAVRREFEGVREQVRHHLLQLIRVEVEVDFRRLGPEIERDLPALRQRGKGADHPAQEGHQITRRGAEGELSGFEPGQIEQLFDQLMQPLRMA